jgi:drug/metabolite transporter (DMT)-like permease
VGPKVAAGTHALAGDALALGAAWFYAAYLLAVARLRTRHGTAVVMFVSTLIFSVLLLPVALTEQFLPVTGHGWLVVLGCALSAQALGQSLIAYGLAHLPATLGAVALYLQVVASAVYAWLLLDERLSPLQLAGGVIVLVAIALARAARVAPAQPQADAAPLPD